MVKMPPKKSKTKDSKLETLTVVELKKLAKEKNISLTGITRKVDIIQAIEKSKKPISEKLKKSTQKSKKVSSPLKSSNMNMEPETKKMIDQFVRTVLGTAEENWGYYGITVAPEDMPRLLFKNPKTFKSYDDTIVSEKLIKDSHKDMDEFVRLVSERGEFFNHDTIVIALQPEGLKKEVVVFGDSERISHVETYRVGAKVSIQGVKGRDNLVIVPRSKNMEGLFSLWELQRRLVKEGRLDERKSRPTLQLVKE